uniref:Uncharacterized protein n=1 Tax=Arion vulgaris TaxID=1028688 RepID=A0A0B7AU66_9EUPU
MVDLVIDRSLTRKCLETSTGTVMKLTPDRGAKRGKEKMKNSASRHVTVRVKLGTMVMDSERFHFCSTKFHKQ